MFKANFFSFLSASQVDSIVDVGVSYYSQSQKLQGTENANVLVTADDATQKPVTRPVLFFF